MNIKWSMQTFVHTASGRYRKPWTRNGSKGGRIQDKNYSKGKDMLHTQQNVLFTNVLLRRHNIRA